MFSLYALFTAAAVYCTDAREPERCQREVANIAMLEQWAHPERSLDEILEVAVEQVPPELWD